MPWSWFVALEFVAAAPPFQIQVNPLELLFRPFAYLDFARVYAAHATLIDFFIYVLIFVGITQATLGKRFSGNGGKALAIGVGLFLAFSMLLAERTFGFSLLAFGPLAVGMVLLALAVMLHRFLHASGLSHRAAASLAYIVVFLLGIAMLPEVYTWLTAEVPLLGALLIIALLVSVVSTGASLWPQRHGSTVPHFDAPPVGWSKREPESDKKDRNALRAEKRELKTDTLPVLAQEQKDSQQLIRDIKTLEKHLPQYLGTEEGRTHVLRYLDALLPAEHQAHAELATIRDRQRAILQADEATLRKHLSLPKSGLTPDQLRHLQSRLQREHERLQLDALAAKLEEHLLQGRDAMEHLLNDTKEAVQRSRLPRAAHALREARALEEKNLTLLKKLRQVDEALMAFLKREMGVMGR